jgi:ribosomal protein L19
LKHRTKASQEGKSPQFQVGDTVEVATRIIEGEKERIQVFAGTVIMIKNSADQPELFYLHRPPHRQQRRRRAHLPECIPRSSAK